MSYFIRIAAAKFRHTRIISKQNKDKLDRFSDKLSNVYGYFGPPIIYFFSSEDYKMNLIPSAGKYILVGDETMVNRVREQIVAEFKSKSRVWSHKSDIDIKIIHEKDQYNALKEDKNEDIRLLLCIKVDTEHAKVEYCLPAELPSTIKNANIIIEHPLEQESLKMTRDEIKKNKTIEKLFKGTSVIVLLPLIAPLFWSVDNFTKNSLLFICSQIVFRLAQKK